MAMIQQSVQQLWKVLQCERRKQKPIVIRYTTDSKPINKSKQMLKGNMSDVSTDYISDHSRTPSRGGSSDSDNETKKPNFRRVAAPPGLEAPTEQAHPWSRNKTHQAIMSATKSHQQKNPTGNFNALKDVLDKMDPAEIATVKSLLDSKLRDTGVDTQPSHDANFWAGLGATSKSSCKALQGAASQDNSWRARPAFAPYKGGAAFTERKRQDLSQNSGDTLRTFLRDLSLVDDRRVLTLRKISRLGLDSPKLLETYLSKFGKVERIMISHTLSKTPGPLGEQKTRLRPAALGFALMATVEDAQAALNYETAHVACGVAICVTPFQSHNVEGTD